MLQRKHTSLLSLVTAVVSGFPPTVAFASVGAGAGLPYEDTFSKIVTSLTGPWAWTVAIVCVIIFAWRAVERGGDLGGSTMGFLGPAFICTLLLGAKKLMTFFGQGALMIESVAQLKLWAAFVAGLLLGAQPAFALAFALFMRNRRRRLQERLEEQASPFEAGHGLTDIEHTPIFGPTRAGATLTVVGQQEEPEAARSGVYQRSACVRRPTRRLVPNQNPTVSA